MGQTITKNLFTPEIKQIDPRHKIEGIDVLVVFGVGEDSLSSWLEADASRFLVFVEPQEELFLSAKTLPFFNHPRTRLLYYKLGTEEIFGQIAWEFVLLRFGYLIRNAQLEEVAQRFFTRLEYEHRGVDLLASDSEDMGVKVLTNAIRNLSALPRSRQGISLDGACAGMPAIVCGAGPSLNEAIPLLKTLGSRAVIIAGGSASSALSAQGVVPHIRAYLDPDPPRARFLEQQAFETPFFYQGRFNHALLELVHAPLVWMPGSGNYPLESWLAAECGLFAEVFDGGWTVADFCTSLAAHLGCTTVIYVGMDFSCGPQGTYASQMAGEEHRGSLIELDQGRLYSKRDWLMSAEWIGSFAAKHSEIQWINATAGGLDIPGVERQFLGPVTEELLTRQWDVEALLSAALAETPKAPVTPARVAEVRAHLLLSFEKTHALCSELLKVWEKHYPHSPLETGEYAVLEHDLEGQICMTQFLIPLWNIWKWPILRTTSHPLARQLHRLLFFKQALELHLSHMRSSP